MRHLGLVLILGHLASAQTVHEQDNHVLLRRRIVSSSTGETVQRVQPPNADRGRWAQAASDHPGWFFLGHTAIEVATGRTKVLPREVVTDHHLRALDAHGELLWQRPVTAPARWCKDRDSVYVSDATGIVAYEAATGYRLWSVLTGEYWAQGLAAGSLWATQPREGGVWVVALEASSGREQLRFRAADSFFRVWGTGRFAFVREGFLSGATTVSADNRVLFTLTDDFMIHAADLEGDLLLVSTRRVARLGPQGRVCWEVPLEGSPLARRAWLTRLANGDALLAYYCSAADSGVTLLRVGLAGGSLRWTARAAPIGVGHSIYQQYVYGQVRGREVVLVSQAYGGDFLEVRDLETGERRRRWCFRQGERCEPQRCVACPR